MKLSQPRIAMFSKGRSWLWDLFLALQDLDAIVSFYTDVPLLRLRKFGYSNQPVKSFFTQCFPYFALSQLGMARWNKDLNRRWIEQFDSAASEALNPCDLFVGLSGSSLKTPKTAKSKYGAQIWIERGSVHILEQKKILDGIENIEATGKISNWEIERELEGYELADRIVVPSAHVAQSFYDRGIKKEKLFINGYGVDLSNFPPTQKPKNKKPVVIFVGGWIHRKGCDLLNQLLLTDNSFELIHVGTGGKCPFPSVPHFKSVGHVIQTELSNYYAKADLLVLPSREEGQSLVLSQALACGVPIVCSPKSGGKDLLARLGSTPAIKVLPDLNLETLKLGIKEQLDFASTQSELRDLLGKNREILSWRGYAKSYLEEVHRNFDSLMHLGSSKAAQK